MLATWTESWVLARCLTDGGYVCDQVLQISHLVGCAQAPCARHAWRGLHFFIHVTRQQIARGFRSETETHSAGP